MDRYAILLYLQNIRDLEIARRRIIDMRNDEYSSFSMRMNSCQVKPQYQIIPRYDESRSFIEIAKGLIKPFLLCLTGSILMYLIFAIIDSGEVLAKIIALFIIFGVPFLIIAIYRFSKLESKKVWELKMGESIRKAEEFNAQQDAMVQQGKERIRFIKQQWQPVEQKYKKRFDTVCSLLKCFYEMNILASPYRNLASILYIYDYMSTSQATLEDTLIHEHLENGIQRLEAHLDQIVSRLDDIVFETRCIRDENRASVEKTIDQNNQMLNRLQTIADNTLDAAQYAELASNYSKANAYFALATYLK